MDQNGHSQLDIFTFPSEKEVCEKRLEKLGEGIEQLIERNKKTAEYKSENGLFSIYSQKIEDSLEKIKLLIQQTKKLL